MKIVTCIKQVRDLDLVLPEDWVVGAGGAVDIAYAKPIINTYDESALEMMLRLADQEPKFETAAITVGGEESEPILQKALAIRVDQGVRIEKRLDPLHSPRTVASLLSKGVQALGDVSLVLCGRQAGMNDHGQTGPLLAEYLGWPCITLVTSIELRDGKLVVAHQVEEGVEEVEITGPVVLTVTQTSDCYLRMATLRDVLEAKKKTILQWSEDTLGMEARETVAKKPLSIYRVTAKETEKNCEMMDGDQEQAFIARMMEEVGAVLEEKGANHDH